MKCPDPWDFYSSSPIYYNGAIYFGSGDSSIYCLNADNGKKIWSYKTHGIVHSSPAIYNNLIICGSWDSRIYAFNAGNGELVWQFQTGIDSVNNCFVGIQASPAISDGIVYCGSRDAFLYALDAKSGRSVWAKQDPYLSWLPSSVAIKGQFLYSGSSDAVRFYIFDRSNGEIVSEYRTGIYTFSSPTISGQSVYIGSMNGKLYNFDIRTGLPRWVFSTDASLNSLYFAKNGNFINENSSDIFDDGVCWELVKSIERIVASSGSILSSPWVDNGAIYFSSTDGYVYALENGNSNYENIEYFDISEFGAEVNCKNEILYRIKKPVKVSISILNSERKLVKSLLNEEKPAGSYVIKWDGTDKENQLVAPSIYDVRISFGQYVKHYKIKINSN